jgi:signal transduction histidine kinase
VKEDKILIVEDEEEIQRLCKRTLNEPHYHLTVVSNGDQALELMKNKTFDFDLVITDLMMPGSTDGKKLLREVKNKSLDTDVIIITAFPTTETAVLALREGAYDYVIKPFSPEQLRATAARCFEKRHLKTNLEHAYKELKTANDSREMLIQLLVHDMKNPLSSITGNVQLLLMDPREGEEKETLEDILRSSERLYKMIIDLLDIGRMEESKLIPHYQPLQLKLLFNEIGQLMQRQFEQRKIQLVSEVQPADLILLMDHELMLRVLQNFLDNSLHYTPGGGMVELYAENGKNNCVVIRIKDNGVPIPKEFKEMILTRYGRLNTTGGRANRGLGLYFCKLAVEAHGGVIEVEDVQQGCSFIIRIPAKINHHTLITD